MPQRSIVNATAVAHLMQCHFEVRFSVVVASSKSAAQKVRGSRFTRELRDRTRAVAARRPSVVGSIDGEISHLLEARLQKIA